VKKKKRHALLASSRQLALYVQLLQCVSLNLDIGHALVVENEMTFAILPNQDPELRQRRECTQVLKVDIRNTAMPVLHRFYSIKRN
jgi:hypothetical protein